MSGVIDGLLPNINDILGIRDDLGVALKQVYMVTRTWSGTVPGDGTATEVRVQMLPSPRVVEFKNDLRIREGGAVKQGDVMLKMVSKETYSETDLDFKDSGTVGAVEKFYELSGELYRPLSVTEKHVTWSVMLRRVSDQGRP